MKFYTEEGNWDLVGNNTPIFFIRDPIFVSTSLSLSFTVIIQRTKYTNSLENCYIAREVNEESVKIATRRKAEEDDTRRED